MIVRLCWVMAFILFAAHALAGDRSIAHTYFAAALVIGAMLGFRRDR